MGKKYLLLMQSEEELPEQFSSYMFLVMQVIDLAKKLGRTFVLPHLHSQPRNAALAEAGERDYEKMILGRRTDPMKAFFAPSELQEYVNIISFDKFVHLSGKELSVLCCFGKDHVDTIETYGESFHFRKAIRCDSIYGLTGIEDPFLGITGLVRGRNGVRGDPNWHDHPTLDYWEIRKRLVYSEPLLEAARDFMTNHLPDPYLAIHWRRSDRIVAGECADDFPQSRILMRKQLQALVNLIKQEMRKRNLKLVFLATDSGVQWHLDYLHRRLPIVQYPASGAWENLQKEGVIEQIICINADHFISSPARYTSCSSFSRWIIDARKLMGRGDQVTYRQIVKQRSFIVDALNTVSTMREASRKLHIRRILRLSFRVLQKWAMRLNAAQGWTNRLFPLVSMLLAVRATEIEVGGVSFRLLPIGQTVSNLQSGTRFEHHEVEFVLSALEPGMTFVDVGANAGLYTCAAAKKDASCQTYAFEPSRSNFQVLQENLKLNAVSNVMPYQIALGDYIGKATLWINAPDEDGLHTIGRPSHPNSDVVAQETVPITTLDAFVENHGIAKIDVIKIDVEGAELLVLKGAKRLLKREDAPLIMYERHLWCEEAFGYKLVEIEDLLKGSGYSLFVVNGKTGQIFAMPPQYDYKSGGRIIAAKPAHLLCAR